jgi:hypothetical protein
VDLGFACLGKICVHVSFYLTILLFSFELIARLKENLLLFQWTSALSSLKFHRNSVQTAMAER